MTVRKRGKKWFFDFMNHAHRGVIPEARTKYEAEQAESKIRAEVFAETYGASQIGNGSFEDFARDVYLPWAKDNKRSWRTDQYIVRDLIEAFKGKSFNEISPLLVETLKHKQRHAITKRGTERAPASVNMVLSVGSRIFTLAIDMDPPLAMKNPFCKVKKFKPRNQQYRYLLDDEEPALLGVVEKPNALVVLPSGKQHQRTRAEIRAIAKQRAHLLTMVPVAVGTGLRKGEQLPLQVKHCDFQRRLVIATDTKNGQTREVPMNDDVLRILLELCRGRRREDYVWVNPDTKRPYRDVKRAFPSACSEAGIEGLEWRHLRATFGTRLGEAGYNAFEIASLMGHEDVRVTMRYVRMVDSRKRQAVQATMLRKVAG